MITTLPKRLRDPERNLEVAGDAPPITLMLSEMEEARTDANWYLARNQHAYDWAHSRWDGQTLDGRKHSDARKAAAFPWEGASDARLRTVGTIIGEHVTLVKWAYRNSRIQARAIRPLVGGRKSKKATTLLTWIVFNQLRNELRRELPLAWWWKFCYGAAFLKVDWVQSRRLEMMPLTMEDLVQLVEASGNDPQMIQLLAAIGDENQEESVAVLIQSFSEILGKDDARKIVRNLREKGSAEIPVSKVFKHQPQVTALRPGVEVLFPSDLDDPQGSNTRWIAQYELVTETELQSRIQTDGYDPKFVAEATQKKGQLSDANWFGRTAHERENVYAGEYSFSAAGNPAERFKNLIELVHFYRYAVHHSTPCLYHTIFSAHVKAKGSEPALYAWDGPFEYDHGNMPYIAMRRQLRARSIYSSIGIAEEAYTDEQAIKVQEDGVTDRTALAIKPPLTVPTSRALAIQNDMRPGAVMGVSRQNEIRWLELPPFDQTPFAMMERVTARLDRRYALFGNEQNLDPDLKKMRREEVADDGMIELELVFGQIFMLEQQYADEAEVEQVVGKLDQPFHSPKQEIQGQHEILVAVDPRMLDDEYADKILKRIMEGLQLNQGGTANMNRLFEYWMNLVDPDLADVAIDDEETATEREKREERTAVASIMSGIEEPFPQFGNFQLRQQEIQSIIQQPNVQSRLALNQDSKLMLENRLKYYMNQIQQRTQNPGIGRALATKTFQRTEAPQMTQGGQ